MAGSTTIKANTGKDCSASKSRKFISLGNKEATESTACCHALLSFGNEYDIFFGMAQLSLVCANKIRNNNSFSKLRLYGRDKLVIDIKRAKNALK